MTSFKFLVFCLILTAIHFAAEAQSLLKPARVIFYNVENLYDTIDDPSIDDRDFLPSSKLHWNTAKYQSKLQKLARVLAGMCDTIEPLAIGLAEIENEKVLKDLIAQPALKKFNLGIAHKDSPDERGIDVALLYNKDIVEEVFNSTLPVTFSFDTSDRTRDILYFKGFMTEEYSVYFFVNHWPSRGEGVSKSAPKRLAAATALKKKIENIYLGEPYARVIVMGDFNDEPQDSSISIIRSVTGKYPEQASLVNLMTPLKKQNEFSLKHQGKGFLFDQMLVSKNLLNKTFSYSLCRSSASVFKPRWLLFNHPKEGWIPNRTYANGKWVGGFSDHLPIYFDICFH